MRKPPEPAIRWYADESALGLGKRLANWRADVTYVGHPRAPGLKLGMADVDWMRVAAARGWVVFRRDRRIQTRPAELRVFAEAALKTIWLGGKKDMTADQQLELVQRHWSRIEQRCAELGPGPWSLTLTGSGLSPHVWRPRV
jgi:hypothetical protein